MPIFLMARMEGSLDERPRFQSRPEAWERECHDRISRMIEDDTNRMFRTWGPRRYPDRDYGMPVMVARGFKEYAERTAGVPATPAPFQVDVGRHMSRSGMATDYRGMIAEIKAAHRAGRTVFLPMEGAPQPG